MIDCGEGAQINFTKYKLKRNKLNQIFISHLHGDHIYGLPGILSSFNLSNREKPLSIFGPVGIAPFIAAVMKYSYLDLRFELKVVEIQGEGGRIFENDRMSVFSFPLLHRVPTYGYRFTKKISKPKLDKAQVERYQLTVAQIKAVIEGEDVNLADGTIIKNEAITLSPVAPKSYAYCSDTIYHEAVIPHVQGVDLLYHEATYMDDMSVQAAERYHSTTIQAATIAQRADAKRLVIGHFSSRYKDVEPLVIEARTVFEATELADQGAVFEI